MTATAPISRVARNSRTELLEQQVDIATLLKETRRPRRRFGRIAAWAVAALLAPMANELVKSV